MQLSAQSILKLCAPTDQGHLDKHCCKDPETGLLLPMISPFVPEKQVVNGKSFGLSAASYDIRIAHDLFLNPHPGFVLAHRLLECPAGFPSAALSALRKDLNEGLLSAPCVALAHSIEDFAIPHNVAGYVCDKSTYARLHVSAFNTLFDPGFVGNATLEIVNLSDAPVVIKAGDPICQLVFHWLDQATDRPYRGKYQNQPKKPVAAILEGAGVAA